MDSQIRRFINRLYDDNRLMAIATVRTDGYPQTTTVTYAHDGLVLYFLCARDSQKVRNIQKDKKVSLAINGQEENWNRIQALSMGGVAEVLEEERDILHARALLERRFPEIKWISEDELAETAFVRVTPKVISAINYDLGFGHADLVKVKSEDLNKKASVRPGRKAA